MPTAQRWNCCEISIGNRSWWPNAKSSRDHSKNSSPVKQHEIIDKQNIRHQFHYLEEVSRNNSWDDLKVNLMEYREVDETGKVRYDNCWITALSVTPDTLAEMASTMFQCSGTVSVAPSADITRRTPLMFSGRIANGSRCYLVLASYLSFKQPIEFHRSRSWNCCPQERFRQFIRTVGNGLRLRSSRL